MTMTMNVSSVNLSGLVSQQNHLRDVGDWQRERAADKSAGMMCRVNMEQNLKPVLCESTTGQTKCERFHQGKSTRHLKRTTQYNHDTTLPHSPAIPLFLSDKYESSFLTSRSIAVLRLGAARQP
ncbi:unnamed protein product [Pleuronectes platessa]|uniref:Uncharacterized protein n=1 Tax=Pleuronectes platessa TaxID=8262 RepID=A0A9N7TXI8_PLEPL|nr:unnamed protein product [Pleuronectes platessa]